MQVNVDQKVEAATIRAQITRADGTVIDLGIVDAHYGNPIRQWVWKRVQRPLSTRRINRANSDLRNS